MKLQLLFFTLCCSITISEAQTTMGGVFFTDTIIKLNQSPYQVTSNVLVPIGVKVSVEPGVVFNFDNNLIWQIEGSFQAVGTADDSIIFQLKPGLSGNWEGLFFNSSAVPFNSSNASGCILGHCFIQKASTAILVYGSGIHVVTSNICNSGYGIMAYGSGGVFRQNKIHDMKGNAFSTYYGITFSEPNIFDGCEIYDIETYGGDACRLTHNAQLINSCLHDIGANIALAVFEGPNILVEGNSFYNNDASALVIVDGPDASVNILHNDFTNNTINIGMTACYKTPVIAYNNFYSYEDYNIFCTHDGYNGFGDVLCPGIPGSSYFTMDFNQNYFGGLDDLATAASIFDFYDDFEGRAIINFNPAVSTAYDNKITCPPLFLSSPQNPLTSASNPVDFSIFPNPSPGRIHFSFKSNSPSECLILIYNSMGIEIFKSKTQPRHLKDFSVDLSPYGAGIYLVEMRTGDIRSLQKIAIAE